MCHGYYHHLWPFIDYIFFTFQYDPSMQVEGHDQGWEPKLCDKREAHLHLPEARSQQPKKE